MAAKETSYKVLHTIKHGEKGSKKPVVIKRGAVIVASAYTDLDVKGLLKSGAITPVVEEEKTEK